MARISTLLCIITLAVFALPLHAETAPKQLNRERAVYFGMHMHRADEGTKWPAAGFGSWRLWDANVAWPSLEPDRGRWDFARLDRYVAMARLTGVEVLLPLGLSPGWASARPAERSSYAPGNAAEPRNMEDWRNYVRTVATRYKGRIRDFEIWNEPNETGFFSGTPEKLVELTCEAQRVLKSVSPNNRLISPAMVGLAQAPELLAAFLEKGGKSCIDIVGFHFYVPKGPPEALLPLVDRVRSAMKKAGVGHLPLWNTESGWWIENGDGTPTGDDPPWLTRISVKQSGSWVARSLILGRAAGLERFYWYAWDNKSMGLIESSNGAYKPGATAYTTVVRWLAGNDIDSCTEQAGRWVCRLKSKEGNLRGSIVWTTQRSAHSFQLQPGEAIEAVEHLDGRRESGGNIQALRQWQLELEPVLLIVKQRP